MERKKRGASAKLADIRDTKVSSGRTSIKWYIQEHRAQTFCVYEAPPYQPTSFVTIKKDHVLASGSNQQFPTGNFEEHVL